MKGRRKIREKAVAEYLAGDVSYRELEWRYGIGSSTLARWVREHRDGKESDRDAIGLGLDVMPAERSEVPTQVRELQRQLDEARLHNKLLTAMIDIAEEELGVPIRKKRGAKR